MAKKKQAGNGTSRRHIEGSKIAKGLPSVKYSPLQYPHEDHYFWFPVSRIVPKNVKGDLKKAASRSSVAVSVSSVSL